VSKPAELVYTIDENELPEGWRLSTIADLVGKEDVFVDGDWVESKDQDPNGDVRLIQLADIGDGIYRDKSARFLTNQKAIALNCTFLEQGDVLIARMPDSLGRTCIFPGDSRRAVTVVDVAVVRSRDGDFNHRWLMYFANAPAFRGAVASLQSGSTRKRISRKNLARIALPVPPVDQQKHIVAEIEKQFSRLDEAVANLKRYKAAVLKAAVEGRLVETEAELARREGRSYETGEQLLQRILKERRQKWEETELAKMKEKGKTPKDDKWKQKYKEPAAPDTTDLPELPEGWVWASLEMLSDAVGGYAFPSKSFTSSGYQIVKMANVRMGHIDLTQRPSFVSNVDEEILKKYGLADGDVLVTLTGTRRERDYGYVAVVRSPHQLLLNQRIARLRVQGGMEPEFLALALQSEPYRNRFFGYETGNVGQGNVGMAAVTTETVPLAPLDEQRRIVAEVDRRHSLMCETESQVDANLLRAERLRHSVLSMAFTGGLLSMTARDRPNKREESCAGIAL
jgi:type I restriction enzyme S subunit